MSLAFALDLLLGLPLAAVLVIVAVKRLIYRQSPLAHLAVAALLVTTIDWSAPDASVAASGSPFWVGSIITVAWLVLFLCYPDGVLRPRWTLWLLIGFVGLDVFVTLSGELSPVLIPVLLAIVATGLGCQLWRYSRRASPAEREAVRWALLGIVPFLAWCLGTAVARVLPWLPGDFVSGDPMLHVIDRVMFWLVPYAAAAGLLAPSWLGLDRALRQAIVISGVGLVVGIGYAFTLPLLGAGWSAAIAVVLAWPLGWLFGRGADRLVYGRARRPALSGLGRRLEHALDASSVGHVVADAVVRELSVPYASVEGVGRSVQAGDRDATEVLERFPVAYQGAVVATIVVAARRGDSGLLPRDRTLLTALAREAGAALHGAATLAELQAARARIVVAREEERRRLRRDLHDDLAPTISGLGLKAAGANALRSSDRERAGRLIAELEAGLRDAASQIRDLAYGLRPPVLDDRGLVAAITDRIGAGAGASLDITIESRPDELELPAAVELAALRIVQEAVTNVRRHADASRCTVRLDLHADRLVIQVSDDGGGMSPSSVPGIGLASIRERATELGGHAEFTSGPSGTMVYAVLPTRPASVGALVS